MLLHYIRSKVSNLKGMGKLIELVMALIVLGMIVLEMIVLASHSL